MGKEIKWLLTVSAAALFGCAGGNTQQGESATGSGELMNETAVTNRVRDIYADAVAVYGKSEEKNGELEKKYFSEEYRKQYEEYKSYDKDYLPEWFDFYADGYCKSFTVTGIKIEEMSESPAEATVRVDIKPEVYESTGYMKLRLVEEGGELKISDMINDRWTQTARSAREQLQDRLKVYKRIGEIYADYSKGDRAVGAYETLYCTDEYNKAYKEYIDAVGLDEADCPWTGMASNEAKIENMAIMIEPRKYSTDEESDGEYTVMVQFGGANGKDGDRVCVMMAPAGDTYKIANFGTVDEEEGGGYYVNEAFTQVMEVAIDEKKMEKEGEEMWRKMNERGTKEVSNGTEFVEALTEGKSNIAIAEGAVINLTEVLSDAEYFKKDGRYDLGDDETIAEVKARVIREEMPDGSQLTLKGLERYKIEGRGKGATLLIDSRYARVLSFVDCQYIQIENLTLGHTQGGSCLGEVLSLQNVKGCKIVNCDLYGCGTCGIYAEGGNGLDVRNTAIRECSEAIVNLIGNYRPKFTRCDFYKNGEEGGHLFNAMEGCGGVEVEDCYFFGNSNELFGMEGHLKRCKVSHEVDQLGETYSIEFEDCDMNPGQLTKRSDVGPGAH